MGALIHQVNPGSMLVHYPALAEVLKDHVSVDIPQQHLKAWVPLVETIQKGTLRSLPLTNKVIDVVHPDFAAIRALVQNAISDNPTTSTTSSTTSSTDTPTSSSTTPSSSTTTTPGEPQDGLSEIAASC